MFAPVGPLRGLIDLALTCWALALWTAALWTVLHGRFARAGYLGGWGLMWFYVSVWVAHPGATALQVWKMAMGRYPHGHARWRDE